MTRKAWNVGQHKSATNTQTGFMGIRCLMAFETWWNKVATRIVTSNSSFCQAKPFLVAEFYPRLIVRIEDWTVPFFVGIRIKWETGNFSKTFRKKNHFHIWKDPSIFVEQAS